MKKILKQDGREVTLLNPNEKGKKYANELKMKQRFTNDGFVKCDENGIPLSLNKVQKAFRAGYLTARRDSAKAFKSKKR